MIRAQEQLNIAGLRSYKVAAVYVLLVAAVLGAAALCGSQRYREAMVVVAISIAIAWVLLAAPSTDAVLLVWFVATPLASYYIRFPAERSLITFDRVALALGLLSAIYAILSVRNRMENRVVVELALVRVSYFEIAWAGLSVIAVANAVAYSNDFPYALRLAVDSFWLPLLAFHLARYHVALNSWRGRLLWALIALALVFFATGAYEFFRAENLLPDKGALLIREGEVRVNGPFASDSSFAAICVLTFLLLKAAPRLLGLHSSKAMSAIRNIAMIACAVASLLPKFRTVAVALAVSWLLFELLADSKRKASDGFGLADNQGSIGRSLRSRWPIPAAFVLVIGAIGVTLLSIYGTDSDRAAAGRLLDPRNAFVRLATWQYGAQMAVDHPLGVGLANYADSFEEKYGGWVDWILDTKPANAPHSNLLWIWVELGVPGLAVFVIAHVFLLVMGIRALRRSNDSTKRTAAACYLGLFTAYWIPGLTLASGYYSDLNLYFFFSLGLLLSIANCDNPKKAAR